MIKRWSYSRLSDYEQCPLRAKLKYIDKVPEPERPLPKGKTEHANNRGTRVHTSCENYINGTSTDLAPEAAKHFKDALVGMRDSYKRGLVTLEGEWGFDKDWEPADYNGDDCWLRIKADAVVFTAALGRVFNKKGALVGKTGRSARVVDFKTGRRFGNEIKHSEQVMLYALATLIRYPDLKDVTVQLWYFDQNDITSENKQADKWLYQIKQFTQRGIKLTTATEFKANPSGFVCKWCPYLDGACTVGVHSVGSVTSKSPFAAVASLNNDPFAILRGLK